MKHDNVSRPPQLTLILRLLCGGYLVYLAYGLLDGIRDNPLYAAAVAVFALVGLALMLHSGWKLYRKEYSKPNTAGQDETTLDEEQTDEQ